MAVVGVAGRPKLEGAMIQKRIWWKDIHVGTVDGPEPEVFDWDGTELDASAEHWIWDRPNMNVSIAGAPMNVRRYLVSQLNKSLWAKVEPTSERLSGGLDCPVRCVNPWHAVVAVGARSGPLTSAADYRPLYVVPQPMLWYAEWTVGDAADELYVALGRGQAPYLAKVYQSFGKCPRSGTVFNELVKDERVAVELDRLFEERAPLAVVDGRYIDALERRNVYRRNSMIDWKAYWEAARGAAARPAVAVGEQEGQHLDWMLNYPHG